MTPTEQSGTRRVELHVRESLPAVARGRRDAIEARLERLASAGRIEEFDVFTWPKRIPCQEPDARAARDRYLAFVRWARERGVRLTPFFGTRRCCSAETGEWGDWLVFPALCLAVYDGGELTAVYPHGDEEGTLSVADGLDGLDRPATSGDRPPNRELVIGRAD